MVDIFDVWIWLVFLCGYFSWYMVLLWDNAWVAKLRAFLWWWYYYWFCCCCWYEKILASFFRVYLTTFCEQTQTIPNYFLFNLFFFPLSFNSLQCVLIHCSLLWCVEHMQAVLHLPISSSTQGNREGDRTCKILNSVFCFSFVFFSFFIFFVLFCVSYIH